MRRTRNHRYLPPDGHDIGPLARRQYEDTVVRKAGLFPGDRALDVQTGNGWLGNAVARAFTKARVVATDEDRQNVAQARANAQADGCAARMDFVVCAADGLPFIDEVFSFALCGWATPPDVGELDILDEVHRTTHYSGKAYAPSLEYPAGKARPAGATAWLFDDDGNDQAREIGFGKVQKQRIARLPDGGRLFLTTMKRFDPDEDE